MYSGFWQTREDNHVKLTGRIVLSTTFMCILFANSYDTDQVLKKKEERERGKEKDRKETEVGITTCMENQGTLELIDKIVLFSIPARER